MTFLQPYLLFALPLIGIPILIHLINQNRHRTIHWAATMFLLQARRMARGMARLRYLLILLARMLALAGLIFAVSRPMSGGWLGFSAGATPDTTIIVLDRSASLEERGSGSDRSKRDTGLAKLAELIRSTGRQTDLVLIENTELAPQQLSGPEALEDHPLTKATATTSNMPALLEGVADYILTNEAGRTDVWICSDLRQHDWSPASGRWETLRRQLADRDGVRLYLLNYPQQDPANLSVTVSGVHRRETAAGAELVLDIKITRATPVERPLTVPVSLVVNGARTSFDLELNGSEVVRNGYSIPLAADQKQGWGRVELPGDANPADNIARFVFSEPAVQKTVIVAENREVARVLELAAGTPADRSLTYTTEQFTPATAATLPWAETGLILWQAPLPTGLLAEQMQEFLRSGRTVIFFPPLNGSEATFLGARWQGWRTHRPEPLTVARWRTDSDLLSNTLSGAPLPVGDLVFLQSSDLDFSEGTVLAHLGDQAPGLLRVDSELGAAYFCVSLPLASHTNFAENGIVLYVMLQRALSKGAAVLSKSLSLVCGEVTAAVTDAWQPLDDLSAEILLSERATTAGLYEHAGTLIALNRPLQEDLTAIVNDEQLAQMLGDIRYTSITDEAGSSLALASEVWRIFLALMIAALMLEALLCIPDRVSTSERLTFGKPGDPSDTTAPKRRASSTTPRSTAT